MVCVFDATDSFAGGIILLLLLNGVATAVLAWIGFVATSMVVNHRFGGACPMLTVIGLFGS